MTPWFLRGTIVLPAREWTTWTVALRDATPVDPAAPRLDTNHLYRLVLHDVTALTGRIGRNEIQLDTIVIE